ncbi:MAG: pyruvate formate lyase-activating protein [Bacteroidaceae bacterium]|nr:pyruvate formate lyase-activating protein [Bacteroidaceae bacterium]
MRRCKKLFVHSFESFGSVDGPGIRFIVFVKGCAMRCAYCHNPDTWSRDGAEEWAIDDILDRAERYRVYWGADGGITVSGGEAMIQAEAVTELFEIAHERGINTCLDTSAQPYHQSEKMDALLRASDTVLLDIKHIDDKRHKELTGHTNKNILDCAKRLSELGVPVWIRHVLVPGWTDDEPSLQELNAFLRTLDNIRRIEILPYHTLGVYKWEQLGIKYRLDGVLPPTEESVRKAESILREGVTLI